MIDYICTFKDEADALAQLGAIFGAEQPSFDLSRCIPGLTVTRNGATLPGYHILIALVDPSDALGALPQAWLILDRPTGLPLWASSDPTGVAFSPVPAGANYAL